MMQFSTIKKILFSLSTLFLVQGVVDVKAQFVIIDLDVEPEVDTQVIQSLDFGTMMTNSGVWEINLGSPNMGVFRVDAVRTQRLLVSLDVPEYLVHQSQAAFRIPISLRINYTNFGVNNYRQSTPATSELEDIVIEAPPGSSAMELWSSLYIYVYGEIDVGNIPVGTYRGDVVLTIIYE